MWNQTGGVAAGGIAGATTMEELSNVSKSNELHRKLNSLDKPEKPISDESSRKNVRRTDDGNKLRKFVGKEMETDTEEEEGIDSGFMSGAQVTGDDEYDDNRNDDTARGNFQQSVRPEIDNIIQMRSLLSSSSPPHPERKDNIAADDDCNFDSGVDLSKEINNLSLQCDDDYDGDNMKNRPSMSLKVNSNNMTITTSSTTVHNTNTTGARSKISHEPTNNHQQRNDFRCDTFFIQNDKDGDTQLHKAILLECGEAAQQIIRLVPHPCLLDIQNDYAETALHLAVLTGQTHIVRQLIISGAEKSIQDAQGNTALHLASRDGNLEIAKALTDPIDTREDLNKGILNNRKTDVPFIRPSVSLPPDLEQRNYDGQCCTHLAAIGGSRDHIDVLRHLVWYGANINARECKSGMSPLHIAVEQANTDLMVFLLDECRSTLEIDNVTYSGRTAFAIAAYNKNTLIKNYLQKYGAEYLSPFTSSDEDESETDDENYEHLNRERLNRIYSGNNNMAMQAV